MKKKILRSVFCFAYIMSALHAMLLIYGLIRLWVIHTGIWTPQIIGLAGYSFTGAVKHHTVNYLVPTVIYALIGYIVQRIYKKN